MKFRFDSFLFKGYRSYWWMGLGVGLGAFFCLRGAQLYYQAVGLKAARELVYLEGVRLEKISPSLNEINKHAQAAHLAFLEKWLKTYQPKGIYAFYKDSTYKPGSFRIEEFSDDLRARLEGFGIDLEPGAEFNLDGLAPVRELRSLQEDALSYLWQCLLKARPQSLLGLKVDTEKDRLQEHFLIGVLSKENGLLDKSYLLYCRVGFVGYTESLRVLLELLSAGPYAFIIDKVSAQAREGTIKQEQGFIQHIPGEVEFTLGIAVVKNRWIENIES